jgi:thiamine biosynthesis lipoprotein
MIMKNETPPKSMKRRWMALGVAIILVFVTRFLIQTFIPSIPWEKQSWQSLYTQVNLTIQGDSLKVGQSIKHLDQFFTTYTKRYQQGSSFNKSIFEAKQGDTLKVDSLSFELLKYAEKIHKESDGFIHPGIGNLIKLWGLEYGQTPKVPDSSSINAEVKKMESLFYSTIESKRSIAIHSDSNHIALGAFSKGYALEYARQYLLGQGFESFLLEIGGDLVYNGKNPRGKNWAIGLTDPREKGKLFKILKLPFNHHSLATSGGYENFFKDSLGVKHHHILDPKTGRSTKGLLSSTVLAKSGHEADYLATFLFIQPHSSKLIQNIDYIILNDEGELSQSPKIVDFLFAPKEYVQ